MWRGRERRIGMIEALAGASGCVVKPFTEVRKQSCGG